MNIGDYKFLIATCNSDEQPMLIDLKQDAQPEGIPYFDWVSNSEWTQASEKTVPQELSTNDELFILYTKIEEHLNDLYRQGQETSEENWQMEKAHHAMGRN